MADKKKAKKSKESKAVVVKEEPKLTTVEKDKLKILETTVETHSKEFFKSFLSIGKALQTIKDGKLYREQSKTFAGYCERRFGFSRFQGINLANAYSVHENLLTIVNNKEEKLLLTKESQYREFARLKTAEKQQEAYKKIEKTCAEGTVTAKNIREVIKEFIGDSGQTRQKRTVKFVNAEVKITDKGIEFGKLDSEMAKIITKMKEALAKGKSIKISY
jgi:hypothetical protein